MATVSYQGRHSVRCGVKTCQEAFSFEVDLHEADTTQDLFVDVRCHWCQTPLVLNLKPYLTSLAIFKSPQINGAMRLDLPDELEGSVK